jgi:hypothetical protein
MMTPRSSILVLAMLLKPSRADAAKILHTKGPMAVRPDRQYDGDDRHPEKFNHYSLPVVLRD